MYSIPQLCIDAKLALPMYIQSRHLTSMKTTHITIKLSQKKRFRHILRFLLLPLSSGYITSSKEIIMKHINPNISKASVSTS